MDIIHIRYDITLMVLIIADIFCSNHSMSSGTMPPSTAVAEYNTYDGRMKCIRAPTTYIRSCHCIYNYSQ